VHLRIFNLTFLIFTSWHSPHQAMLPCHRRGAHHVRWRPMCGRWLAIRQRVVPVVRAVSGQ
jgi:hypothetical protein